MFGTYFVLLFVGLFHSFSGAPEDSYEDIASRKWSIFKKFDQDYLTEIMNLEKCKNIRSLYGKEFDFMLVDLDTKQNEIYNPATITNDKEFFLGRGIKIENNIQVFVDLYIKYQAMWSMLIFKVCSIWEAKTNSKRTNIRANCDAVARYMEWFRFANFDRIALQPGSDKYDGSKQSILTADEISNKLRYLNAVSLAIYTALEPTHLVQYEQETEPTNIVVQVLADLKRKNTFLFQGTDQLERESLFEKQSYEEIWLTLLDIYGEDLLIVDNYFRSLIGDNQMIQTVNYLVPPKSEIEPIWNSTPMFMKYLGDKENTSNMFQNKGGKILMQIEKMKEMQKGIVKWIDFRNLVLHKATRGSFCDYKITLQDNDVNKIRISTNEILVSLFPNPKTGEDTPESIIASEGKMPEVSKIPSSL